MYNGLFNFSEDLHVHPELAEAYDISEDGLTYTFKIKEGVYLHDDQAFENGRGREVIAEDFVYTYKRLLDSRVKAKGAWVFADKVKRGPNGALANDWIVALDKYRIKITLSRRFPAFLQILAMPFTKVIPKEAEQKYGLDFRKHPVGTGPFMLKYWREKERLILIKNPRYWKRDIKNRPLPYIDAVEALFNEDKAKAFLDFEKGFLDFLTNIPIAQLPRVLNKNGSTRLDFKSKYGIEKKPYILTEYIGFLLEGTDQKTNPLLNLKVRKALSYAINREYLLSTIRNGLGTPGKHGYIPDAISSYDAKYIDGYTYNIKKAQKLLQGAGYPLGRGFPEITLNTYNTDKALCTFLQKQWSQNLGIKVKVVANQFATHKDKVDQGKARFFRGSWRADYPDAENFLAMFYSKNEAPAGPNKTRFKDATFDKLFVESQETDNTFTRYGNYHAMDQLIIDKVPVIVLYYDEVVNLRQKNITGLKTNTMNTLILEKADIKK